LVDLRLGIRAPAVSVALGEMKSSAGANRRRSLIVRERAVNMASGQAASRAYRIGRSPHHTGSCGAGESSLRSNVYQGNDR
jgi:hypothetical protein